ncbi:MAG: hypothetical protein HYY37_05165 [Candidatus Aenigmarchaeota archaeon]|nr:hypothetical protein [Candidatus Aenigmarchaeota archaeon]
MGLLARLKQLFRRKQPEVSPEPASSDLHASPEPAVQLSETPVAKKPALLKDEREQKSCAKCSAPNDIFVHKCWLCKEEI